MFTHQVGKACQIILKDWVYSEDIVLLEQEVFVEFNYQDTPVRDKQITWLLHV